MEDSTSNQGMLFPPVECVLDLMSSVIQHVCRTGRAEFKREMARKVDPIKDCLRKMISNTFQL